MENWKDILQILDHCAIILEQTNKGFKIIWTSSEHCHLLDKECAKWEDAKNTLPSNYQTFKLTSTASSYIYFYKKVTNTPVDHHFYRFPGIVYELNAKEEFQYISENINQFLPISAYDLLSHKKPHLLRLIHQHTHQPIKRLMKRRHKNILEIEHQGKFRYFSDEVKPVYNRNKEIIRYDGFIEDITEQIKKEVELKKQKKKLQVILKHSSIGTWEWSLSQKKMYFDENAEKLLNINSHSFNGGLSELLLLIHPNERFSFQEDILNFLRRRTKQFEKETKIIKDNDLHWILIRGTVEEYDSDGKVAKVIGTIIDLDHQKKMEKEIMQNIVNTQEEERRRFATDLHDGLGQYLAAIKMNFDALSLDNIDKEETMNTIKNLLDHTIKDLRNISHNLMPGAVEDLGLIAAIKEIQHLTNNGQKINFDFHTNKDFIDLPPQIAINLYRIIQELVNNTIKHSGANKIILNLECAENQINIKYQDNGVGLKKKDLNKDGLGMKNLKSRLFSIGGTMNISTGSLGGFEFTGQFPLNSNPIL